MLQYVENVTDSGISVFRNTKFSMIYNLTHMVLVFGLVVGLWETLAGGFFPSIQGEEGLGQEEQQQKCDHGDQKLYITVDQ